MIAKILHLMLAEPAVAIGAAHPGDTHARSYRHCVGSPFHYFSNDLVSWDQVSPEHRQIAFDNVEVGTTDTARDHPQQNMSRLKLRARNILNTKAIPFSRELTVIDGCFHESTYQGSKPLYLIV
jgi:hypothetical protein